MSELRGRPSRSRSAKGRMVEKRADIARSSYFMPAKTVDCCQRPPSTLMDPAAVSFVARSVSSSRASYRGACEVIAILPPNTCSKSGTLDGNKVMHAFAMRSAEWAWKRQPASAYQRFAGMLKSHDDQELSRHGHLVGTHGGGDPRYAGNAPDKF